MKVHVQQLLETLAKVAADLEQEKAAKTEFERSMEVIALKPSPRLMGTRLARGLR